MVKEGVAEEESNIEDTVKVVVISDGACMTDSPDESGRKCEELD